MNNRLAWVALSANEFIGPKRLSKILKNFPKIEDYLDLSVTDQIGFLHLDPQKVGVSFQNMKGRAEEIMRDCERLNVKIITRKDEDYPVRLKDISDAPFLLYVRGTLKPLVKKVAVVGTRHAGDDAREVNRYFVREMVQSGLGIVSGLAAGHDSIAQKQTVELGGYTIAVLGNGIDKAYPVANRNLFHKILEEGAIVSEYPPQMSVQRWFFPLRNRIISGLSDGVWVVQAPVRSGALITAQYAEAQGRELYVVPGNVSDSRNAGSNRLIQNGAKIVLEPSDLIRDLLGNTKSGSKVDPELVMQHLEEEEQVIYRLLERPYTVDELVEKSKQQAGMLNALLMKLELKGVIAQDFGRMYYRVNHIG